MAATSRIDSEFRAVDRFTSPLKAMARSSKNFTAKAERQFRNLNKTINRATKGLGGIAAIAGGLTIGSAVSSGADAFLSLDKSISAASAKFGVFDRGSETFKQIRDEATKLGGITEFTSGQVAEGFNFMAMAGFDASDSIAAISGVIDLATAAQVDLGTATDIATDTLGAFNMASAKGAELGKNLSRVNNVLAATTTATNTSMEDLFESVKVGGPAFTSAGQSIETFSALAGRMASNAIKGSTAGTALRSGILRLAKPTAEVSRTLSKLGVNITDQSGNMRNMIDIVNDISKSTKGMGNVQKSAALGAIFGKNAFSAWAAVINEGVENSAALEDKLKNLKDPIGDMSKFMRSGLSGAVASMKSGFEAVAIAIGDVFQPEIDAGIASMTNIARTAKDWIANNKQLLTGVGQLAKSVLGVVVTVKAITIAFTLYRKAQMVASIASGIFMVMQGKSAFALRGNLIALKAYSVAMTAFSTISKIASIATTAFGVALKGVGIGWIIAGVVLLIAGVILLIKNWDRLKESISGSKFGKILKGIWTLIKTLLIDPIKNLFGGIGKILGLGKNSIDINNTNKEDETTDKPVSLAATQTSVQTERMEQIQKEQTDVIIKNESRNNVETRKGMFSAPKVTPTFG